MKEYSDNWTKAYLDDICHHSSHDSYIIDVNDDYLCSYTTRRDPIWTQLEKLDKMAEDRLVSYADVCVTEKKSGIKSRGRLQFAVDGVNDMLQIEDKRGSFMLYVIDDMGQTVRMMNVVSIRIS